MHAYGAVPYQLEHVKVFPMCIVGATVLTEEVFSVVGQILFFSKFVPVLIFQNLMQIGISGMETSVNSLAKQR